MNRALRKKYISDAWILFSACAVAVFVFCWFRVWIVGELDTTQFKQIVDLLPDDWRKFASVDFDWMVSYLGRTSLTLDEPMLVGIVCCWSLVRGSDVVSGEINRGTMEMLLTQPVSRMQVYFSHALMTVAGLGLLCVLVWIGMAVGIWSTSVEETAYPELRIPLVDYRIPLTFLKPQVETIAMASEVKSFEFIPGVINLFCLGFFLAGLAACCSALDRFRWRTLGVVFGIYFAGAMLKLLSMSSESYRWAQNVTFFGFYHPASAIQTQQSSSEANLWWGAYNAVGDYTHPGLMANCLVLLVIGTGLFLIGAQIFKQRDLPAPS